MQEHAVLVYRHRYREERMTDTVYSRDPLSAAAASLLVPGLGQWLQGRRWAAAYFLGDVVASMMLVMLFPELRVLGWTAAIGIGIWSVLDAAFAARPRGASAR
jgi:hypothetical protein